MPHQIQNNQNWENLRFAVIDTESTGFDSERDLIVSIAGVTVQQDAIDLSDTFEVMIPFPHNTSSVALHGITRERASGGVPEDKALEDFRQWLRQDIIVGHHIGHDVKMLNTASRRNGQPLFENPVIDTMDLTLRLKDVGALSEVEIETYSLDQLCWIFNIAPHDRHTASGDAFLTAQVFLRLLKQAWHWQWLTLGELTIPYEPKESS